MTNVSNEGLARNGTAYWGAVAAAAAKEAHEENFSSRHGTYPITDDDEEEIRAICYYSNHPFAGDFELARAGMRGTRDAMLADLRAWMATEHIGELGFASYPPPSEGEDQPGYTIAMILGTCRQDAVVKKIEALFLHHVSTRGN